MRLPDDLINEMLQYAGEESSAQFKSAAVLVKGWDTYGQAIIFNYADEHGLDQPDEGKAHNWYIEALAASVQMGVSTAYNHMRVGRNWLMRGYDVIHDVISYSEVIELMRNTGHRGLIPDDILDSRIEWYYDVTEKFGKPPSPRDIQKHYKKNGSKKEWELLWANIVRNAREMKSIEHPNLYDGALGTIIALEDK